MAIHIQVTQAEQVIKGKFAFARHLLTSGTWAPHVTKGGRNVIREATCFVYLSTDQQGVATRGNRSTVMEVPGHT